MSYAIGDCLIPKPDPRKKPLSGNAIIAAKANRADTWVVFTDYGNTMRLNSREIGDHYIVTRSSADVRRWVMDRNILVQDQTREFEELYAGGQK